MIAARLAGGNLFFGFLGWGFFGALGAARSTRIFLRGFLGGDFWSTRSSSEHSDFFEGIFGRGFLEHSEQLGALGFFEGDFFFGGWWGGFWIESVGKN